MLTEENIDMSIAPVFLLYSIYIHISIHSYLYLFLLFSTDQADDWKVADISVIRGTFQEYARCSSQVKKSYFYYSFFPKSVLSLSNTERIMQIYYPLSQIIHYAELV